MKRSPLVFIVLTLSACATGYQPTFMHDENSVATTLEVIPILNQEELVVEVLLQDSLILGAQFGMIGGVVSALVDSEVNFMRAREANEQAEGLRQTMAGYDLVNDFDKIVAPLNLGNNWAVVNTDKTTVTADYKELVTNKFALGTADVVVLLSGRYHLKTELDQFSVIVRQSTFHREDYIESNKLKVRKVTTYTYFSPKHALNYRSIQPEEKDQYKSLVRRGFKERIAAKPDSLRELTNKMNKKLRKIDKSKVIPDHLAIADTWTADLLQKYLAQAKLQLTEMIRFDWDQTTPPPPEAYVKKFITPHPSGYSTRHTAASVAEGENYEVLLTEAGLYFSFPK